MSDDPPITTSEVIFSLGFPLGQKPDAGCPQAWRSSAESQWRPRAGGWGAWRLTAEAPWRARRPQLGGGEGLSSRRCKQTPPHPAHLPAPSPDHLSPKDPAPSRIPKTAASHPPLRQPDPAPSAAWQTPGFCPTTLRQALVGEAASSVTPSFPSPGSIHSHPTPTVSLSQSLLLGGGSPRGMLEGREARMG